LGRDGDSNGTSNIPFSPNLMLCDQGNGEAVAVNRSLMAVFGKKESWLEDQDVPSRDYATIVMTGQPSSCLFSLPVCHE